jgi:DNA adenine methylase
VKWTGGKRRLAPTIAGLAPPHHRYVEPFLGGAAVLYLLARPGSIGADAYPPLMDLWRLVQREPARVVAHYRHAWSDLQSRGPSAYYDIRDRFNRDGDPLDLNFLLRTCVNGIVRFNRDGRFNNSLHVSRPGIHPDRFARIADAWSGRLQGVELRTADYRATLAEARRGDFVYLDPPYAGTQQRYAAAGDGGPFHPPALFEALDDLNRRRIAWALSYDGQRAGRDLSGVMPVPRDLYARRLLLIAGHSPVAKVLNGPLEVVEESLYLSE